MWTWTRGQINRNIAWTCYHACPEAISADIPQNESEAEQAAIQHTKETGHPTQVSRSVDYDIVPALNVGTKEPQAYDIRSRELGYD